MNRIRLTPIIMGMLALIALLPTRAAETAAQPSAIRVPATAPGDAISAEFRLGSPSPMTIKLEWADGKSQTIRVTTGNEKVGDKVIPDASLTFQGLGLTYYIRPRPIRYTEKQQAALVDSWLAMPSAIEKYIKFAAIPDARGVAFSLDDRYAGRLDKDVALQAVTFQLPTDGTLRNEHAFRPPSYGRYLPLNFAAVAQPGAMQAAKASLPKGLNTVKRIPMLVTDGATSGDIARVKEMRGSWALECDEYLSRTTFDGMPESQLITVPQAYYSRALVLFAVDPDPKKDPIMTVRLTRFAGGSEVGRGGAIADATIRLPRKGERLPKNITRVGTVRQRVNARNVTLPLYLAEVEMPIGEILDLISTDTQDPATLLKIGPYLDFEILGRCGEVGIEWDNRHKPTGAPSAANVFGVTLERAPAELRLAQTQVGNIFYNDETPETIAAVKAVEPGRYTLRWTIADAQGKTVREDSKTITLAAGEETRFPVSLAMQELGYYGLQFTLTDAAGTRLLTHNAAFALLGQDTREAGYESPYSVWWFGGSHLTNSDIKLAGPLHLKAGIRRTMNTRYSEAEMAPWKMTLGSFGNAFGWVYLSTMDSVKERVETQVKKQRERYPHCSTIYIFHEGLANSMPEELAGAEPTFNEKERGANERTAKLANAIGQFYREKFPDLKIVVGNNSGTAKLMADLFRFGFDRQYADYIGIEAPGMSIMPEAISEHGIMATWMAREIARKYGHTVPMTGCYEFTYRMDSALGAEKQAAYYVRDILISHAYQFDQISPGVLDDPGGSYYNTLWGGSGIVQRGPLFYPKPSYVAIATATKVLDKGKLSRVLPTGSLSVYALEMPRDRAVKDFAYAMWTPRGEAELTFDFGQNLTVTLVDLYGRETVKKTVDGKVTVPTSSAASYLISPAAVRTVAVSKRTFLDDQPPASFTPANRMEKLAEWEMVADERLTGTFSKRGDFTLREVTDAEKGACLELELHKAPGLEPLVSEYTSLKLKKPVRISGTPHTIGLWVKGNSNWGSIYFDIVDRDGTHWRSAGGLNDWPADLAVNFDGWRFLCFHLDPARSPIKALSPGAPWIADGKGGLPAYPIAIVGIDVAMRHQALDPVEMRDVTPVLRFKDLGAYE